MKTPFEILEISENSDDKSIKKAYLQMVKRYPPELFPADFQRIRASYECIKTQKDRIRFALFDTTMPVVEELILDIRATRNGERPDIEMLRKLIAASTGRLEVAG
jgi:DnaJ-class molecular chaperone